MPTNTNFFNATYKKVLTATAGFLMTMGVIATTAPDAQAQFNPLKNIVNIFKKEAKPLNHPHDAWGLYEKNKKTDGLDTQIFYSMVQIPVDPNAPKAPVQSFTREPKITEANQTENNPEYTDDHATASIDPTLDMFITVAADTAITPPIPNNVAPAATTAVTKPSATKDYKHNKKLSTRQQAQQTVAKAISQNIVVAPKPSFFDPIGFLKNKTGPKM
jgi:hypothetical protein